MELHNRSDIDRFVSGKTQLFHFNHDDNQTRIELQERAARRSNGMFLWASITIDRGLEERDGGTADCLRELSRLPDELLSFYGQILSEGNTRYRSRRGRQPLRGGSSVVVSPLFFSPPFSHLFSSPSGYRRVQAYNTCDSRTQ